MSPAQRSAAVRSFEAQWLAREPDALSGLRERALQRFLKLGMPTTRDESWRYTNLRPLAAQSFVDAPRAAREDLDVNHPLVAEASRALLGEHHDPAQTLVLVNGHPLAPRAQARTGLEVRTLSALARENPDLLMRHLEPLSDAEELRWLLLNTALGTDGLHLKITAALATPVLILHVGKADRPGTASYPRVIVEAAPGARATILEHHIQLGPEAPLSNSATLLALEHGARIEHYRLFAAGEPGAGERAPGEQAVHFDTLQVRLDRDADCRQFTIALGGGLVRTSLEASLREPGARFESYALAAGPCGPARRLRERGEARGSPYGEPPNRARHRERHQPGDLQQQSGGRCGRLAVGLAAILPRALAVAVRRDRLAPPARDSHRRRQVRARRHHRPPRSEHAVLHALARARSAIPRRASSSSRSSPTCSPDMSDVCTRAADRERPDPTTARWANAEKVPMNTALARKPLPFDVGAVRREFPVLARLVHGKPLCYLDNGASAQRPRAVIEAVDEYERHHHANIHRGVHTLSQEATALYEGARERIARFVNARSRREIIFVRGTTEAINLVAQSYAPLTLKPGDEVLITHLEHHANIVPWQMVCEQTGAKLVVAPMDARGEVHVEAVESLMSPRTRAARLRARLQRARHGAAGAPARSPPPRRAAS